MRRIVFIAFFSLIWLASWSQLNRKSKAEFGLGLSVMSAYTDIGGTKGNGEGFVDFSLSAQRPGIFGFYKCNINRDFSLKANALIGWLAQKDDGSRNDRRGFAFNTPMLELTVSGIYYIVAEKEPYFYPSRLKNGRSWSRNIYPSMYVKVGVGVTLYKPIPNDKLEQATSAGFEGGKIVAPVLPVGFGSTIPVSRDVRFVLEANYAFTLTDYLDGYSNPKYSTNKDVYFTFNIGLSYQIGDNMISWGKQRNRNYKRR